MQAPLAEPEQAELWLRLLACSTLIEREVRARMRREFAFTLPRFEVLAQLDRAGQALSMGALSDRLMVSAGNITGLIDRLAAEGLVARETDPADRRTVQVRLTPAGRRAFDQMTPTHHAWIADLLDGLEVRDRRALHDLLGRLKTTLEGHA